MGTPETGLEQTAGEREVLTLAEAASFLRVTKVDLSALADRREVPARKVGDRWVFSKQALTDWLRGGPDRRDGTRPSPSERPRLIGPIEEIGELKQEILSLKAPSAQDRPGKPFSKEELMKSFGVWRDDPTADALLEDVYKARSFSSTKRPPLRSTPRSNLPSFAPTGRNF